jgi:hypothetical protein
MANTLGSKRYGFQCLGLFSVNLMRIELAFVIDDLKHRLAVFEVDRPIEA